MDQHHAPAGTSAGSTARSTSSTARTTFRVVGLVLLASGLAVAVRGGSRLGPALDGTGDPGFGPILLLAAGGFLVVFGLAALNAGLVGAQARYAASEAAPAIRTAGAAWRGDGGAAAYCSSCGTGVRSGARFCDACGHGIG